jgi:flagellar motility protein MotE (MotC chaperone)
MAKTGYDQFFKNARNAADGKPAVSLNIRHSAKKSTGAATAAEHKMMKKKKKEKVKFPTMSLFICMMGLGAAYFGYDNYDKISSYIGKIEVSFLSSANAEEAGKKDSNADGATAAKDETKAFTKPVVVEPTGEELNHLMRLAERKKELDAREEELNRMETEMGKQKEEIQKKVADLEKMRNSISSILEEKVKADDQKIDTLVQFYSNMKPPQAAKVFETIDEDLAVQILGRMKKKSAAEILNLMKPEKAQMFTEKFAGYKRTVASTASDAKDDKKTNADDTGDAEAPPTTVPKKP